MLLLLRIFFFNDTATTEIYTLSLHDALPIYRQSGISSLPAESHLAQGHSGKGMCEVFHEGARSPLNQEWSLGTCGCGVKAARSEEHTSELQSRLHLVCRLLLEKKKQDQHVVVHYEAR